jgi:cyanophycinase
LRKIINESKHKEDSVIEIVTTASQIPQIVGQNIKKHLSFRRNVNVLDIHNREEANSDAMVARANAADVMMFTGGDQLRLTSILGGTRFHDTILLNIRSRIYLPGTSAGAAAASENMIYQGSSSEALLKGEIKTHRTRTDR